MADKYLREIAELTGLHYYPKQGPFGKKGMVMGALNGYLVSIGTKMDLEHGRDVVGILVRFRKMEEPEKLRMAIQQTLPVSFGSSHGALAQIGSDFLYWEWSYSFKKPKVEEVARLLEMLMGAVKQTAPKFEGKCEVCNSSLTSEITLLNKTPGYFCESCQQKMRMEQDAEAITYEKLPSNFLKGVVLGMAAALVGGLAWGVVAYLVNRIFVLGAVVIGLLVAWAIIKGMGKINRIGQVLIAVLTIASVLFGDVVFYILTGMRELNVPFSLELFRFVLRNFWGLGTAGPISVFFALLGAGYVLYYKARKPKIKVVFEHLKTEREEPERIAWKDKLKRNLGKSFAIALILSMLLLGYWMFSLYANYESRNLNNSPMPEATTTHVPETQIPSQTNEISSTVLQTPIQTAISGQKYFKNSIGIEFVSIPAGEFDMGSPSDLKNMSNNEIYNERPVHHVKLAKEFYMGKYEVTQKEWREIMGNNPSHFKGDDLPVENVSWNDVQQFIKKLNEKEGTAKYRLPSEAEWEYAVRAGTTTRYYFGDDLSKLDEYMWHETNSIRKTYPVGQKKPNPWGLYDMYGNVWEWVQDKWHNVDYEGAPTDGSAWESGEVKSRIYRGGGLCIDEMNCRSAVRSFDKPDFRYSYLGFRLVRDM